MNCDSFDELVFDYLDGALAPEDRRAFESHLAGCPGCRAAAQRARALDTALSTGASPTGLPHDFAQRLQSRIRAEAPAIPVELRSRRKEELEAEFQTGLAKLKGGFWNSGLLADFLSYTALAVATGWMLWQLSGRWFNALSTITSDHLGSPSAAWLIAGAIGAVCVGAGVFAAMPLLRQRAGI